MFRKFSIILSPVIRSQLMSSHSKSPMDVQLLATYGTLRDDDDSGASWTHDFIKDINHAVTARVVGYRLYSHPILRYPFATFTDDPKDSVVVRLLSWPTKEQFEQQIVIGDMIEGDEYERKIVKAIVNDEVKYAYIYISKVNTLDEDWKVIPSGDWLQRPIK